MLWVDVDYVDLFVMVQYVFVQLWEIGNFDVEMFVVVQIDEIFFVVVVQVVCYVCGEGYEIFGVYGEDVVVDFGLCFIGKDVDLFFFVLV